MIFCSCPGHLPALESRMGRQKGVPKPCPGEDGGHALGITAPWDVGAGVSPKDLSRADQTVPSTQRGLSPPRPLWSCWELQAPAPSSSEGMRSQQGIHGRSPLYPQGIIPEVPVPQDQWWQDLLPQRQSQAQVNDCPGLREKAAGSFPPAPPWQTGSEGEEWRGGGEEVSRRDRRGERGSAGQGWGSSSLRKHSVPPGRRCGSEWGCCLSWGKMQGFGKCGRDELEEQEGARAVGFSPRFHSIFENYSGKFGSGKS